MPKNREDILTAVNSAAFKQFALAQHKQYDEREVEKHTYAGRILMELVNVAIQDETEISTCVENLLEGAPK